ncbi:hypothetical protein [Roseicella sp. DB1501]|uniref:hypothetical protein n=1 Tax=Roseicella sp. DB1501 TaxID=2730925 RepID=UPI001492C98A|nr:hypothetical protein [Roseicella sp. DB1501]NOG69787.1 hypothetical protein [Roseicella sp. DB1501]
MDETTKRALLCSAYLRSIQSYLEVVREIRERGEALIAIDPALKRAVDHNLLSIHNDVLLPKGAH